MKVGEHTLREHLRLLAPLFAFLAAVWLLRLLLDLAGTPATVVRVCSVTVAGAVSVLMAVLLIHNRRFGGYPNIVLSAFLLQCCQQFLITSAIAIATVTGTRNVYSAPEFSGHLSPLAHILGHLTFGVGLGTLFGSAMGSLLLWMLRKFVPAGVSSAGKT